MRGLSQAGQVRAVVATRVLGLIARMAAQLAASLGLEMICLE
jgi:hypothetical protein